MRIISLEITNYRSLKKLTLSELDDHGVILISGENEQGKSTVVEALNNVLWTKYSSKNASVRAAKTINGTEPPEVRLHARMGSTEFVIYKRFINRPAATLEIISPRKANYSDNEADDKLRELLADNLDVDLAKAMFITPDNAGLSFQPAALGALTSALDKQSGGDSGTDATGIIAAAQQEFERYYTAKGKPRAELLAAQEALDKAQARTAEAQARVDALTHDVAEVEAHTMHKAKAEAELPGARDVLRKATEELEAAVAASEVADGARKQWDLARTNLELVTERLTARRELVATVQAHAAELTALEAQLEEIAEAAQAEAARVEEANKAHLEAVEKRNVARERRGEAQDIVRLAKIKKQSDEDAALLEELSALEVPEVPTTKVTKDALEQIAAAAEDLRVAARAVEMAAPKVEVSAAEPTTISRDDEDLSVDSTPQQFVAAAATTLRIGGVSVRIDPGDVVDSRHVELAQAHLDGLLARVGCLSLEAARLELEQVEAATAQADEVRKRRNVLLKDRSIDSLRESVEAARTMLADAEVPEVGEAEKALEQAEVAVDAAQQEADAAQARVHGLSERPAAAKLERFSGGLERVKQQLEAQRACLDELEKTQSLEDLESSFDSAQRAEAEKKVVFEQAAAEACKIDVDIAKRTVQAAAAKEEKVAARILESDYALARLEGAIAQAAGSAEELDLARSEEEIAARHHERVARRAQAARLLLETLLKHRDEARRKYEAPFIAELEKLARPVFGTEVSFTLNDNLDVVSRTIEGVTVEVDQLSEGAKEQLSLLTRFAVARLVSSEGVPIIIDDQLGSTDDVRLMHMGTVVQMLGDTEQVIILTAAPARFDYISGADVREMRSIAVPV